MNACEVMFSRTIIFVGALLKVRLRPSGFDVTAFATIGLAQPKQAQPAKAGGARRDRTDDLMLAKHALSQLSYGPVPEDEMLYAEIKKLCHARLRSIELRRARSALLLSVAAPRGKPKAKRGGPGKT
jgi:hypothetical protein